MRATIRPVTIRRIIELMDFLERNPDSNQENFQKKFELSERRAKAVVAETERINLLREESFKLSDTGSQFYSAVKFNQWTEVNSILRENSPHYGDFLDVLDQATEGLSKEEIIQELKENSSAELKYNATSFSLLSDWAERLGVIQKDVFRDSYYLVEDKDISSPAEKVEKIYNDLQSESGINLKQRYVSIPELREAFCEKYKVKRSKFDRLLSDIYKQNIGKMELSGAPLNTQAKESDIGIKRIEKVEEGDITTTELSSDQILRGIELSDGKIYYYIAIFDDLNEVDPK